MTRSRYPTTSDSSILAGHRGAALAKTIAATGILAGILAIAVLAVHDVQQPSGVGEGFIATAAGSTLVHSTAVNTGRSGGERAPKLQLDPFKAADYRSSSHH